MFWNILFFFSLIELFSLIAVYETTRGLMDLPTEVIAVPLLQYLAYSDLYRMRLNKRLRDIVDTVVQKRYEICK